MMLRYVTEARFLLIQRVTSKMIRCQKLVIELFDLETFGHLLSIQS